MQIKNIDKCNHIPEVTISVFNLVGQLVDILLNEMQEAGIYSLPWDAADCSSGIYFLAWEGYNSDLFCLYWNKQADSILKCGDPKLGFSRYICLSCEDDNKAVAHSFRSKVC